MHSGILDRMLSMVFPCVEMTPVGWCRLIPVWGLSPVWGLILVVEISSNDY